MNPKTEIEGTPPLGRQALIVRAVAQALTFPVILSFVLFLPSGTWNWPAAWILTAVYLLEMLATNLWLIFRHPGLARERLIIPRSTEGWDRRLTSISNILILAVLLPLAGMDHRYGLSPALPAFIPIAALVFFGTSFLFVDWAMSANEFFSSAVRLQTERGQTVAAGGPYRFLRHPGYLAMIAQFFAIPLALESLWALIPACAVAAVYIYRTDREDKLLQEKLPGYSAYARRVRSRLIPGIW